MIPEKYQSFAGTNNGLSARPCFIPEIVESLEESLAKDYLFKDLPGTGKNRTKDLVLGKTRFGRGLRVGATADRIKKFVGKVPKPKSPDGSHVGRRTAG